MLHLVGVGGDTLGSTLALPASWAEVGDSNGGPSDFACYTIKIGYLALGSQVRHGFSGLKSKGNGLHLVGVGGDTLGSTLALPASWAEVGGSNVGPSDFAFYTIKIGNLALGSQVRHGFSGLKSKGNGTTPSRCWRGTLWSTLALPASWAEVRGSNGGPSDFAFYTIKIGNLALGSQVPHRS